ncbi:unnamed protein product [[Candida] boidinii]|nr:unnamed protein product [[Candida] boidinii]
MGTESESSASSSESEGKVTVGDGDEGSGIEPSSELTEGLGAYEGSTAESVLSASGIDLGGIPKEVTGVGIAEVAGPKSAEPEGISDESAGIPEEASVAGYSDSSKRQLLEIWIW